MLVPKLRFKNFKNSWNDYLLEEIIYLKNNKYNPSSNIYYKCIELEHIEQETGNIISYCNSTEQKSIKSIFNKNDILFGKLRPYLKKYWFANFDGVCSTEIWVINSNNKIAINKFTYYIIQTSKFNSMCCISTGTKMPRADWNYIKEYSFYLPSLEEQTKIANFLSLIDRKIELQTQLVDNLKLYKKGLLKKVFSNNKEWKSAKLGNIFQYEQPNNYIVENAEYNSNYTIPVLTANKGFILGYTNETNTYNKGKCIIFDDFTMDFKYVDFPFKVKSSAIKILTAKKEYNINFMYQLLKTITLEPISHQRHYISIVQNIEVTIPNIEEQNRIANLFSNLDKKIEFETKKLQDLKTYKKGLLQKMFI